LTRLHSVGARKFCSFTHCFCFAKLWLGIQAVSRRSGRGSKWGKEILDTERRRSPRKGPRGRQSPNCCPLLPPLRWSRRRKRRALRKKSRSTAAYRQLYEAGKLRKRVEQALALLEDCHLCPRGCGVNRLEGEVGKCRTGRQALVSSFGPHFGEEASLVGSGGSGTIFFTYCNLRCCFCQNYTISQMGEGHVVTSEELAGMMLSLERRGCHNINFVSPTHVVPQVLEALGIAAKAGLSVPLVYNSGGYDSVETLKLLDGVVDIYMPDILPGNEPSSGEGDASPGGGFGVGWPWCRHSRLAGAPSRLAPRPGGDS